MATLSADAPVTPLRRRMQQDMLMRGLGSHTQHDYIRHVRRFAAFVARAPETATTEDIRRFQLYQHENGVGPATINRHRRTPDNRRRHLPAKGVAVEEFAGICCSKASSNFKATCDIQY